MAEAIGAARGGLDPSRYATRADMERDQLTLAYKLAELGDITDVQLTTAEQTLAGIEEQIKQQDYMLEYWKQQIDISQGGVEATLTVEAAVRDIQKWLEAKAAEDAAAAGGDKGGAGGGSRFAIGGSARGGSDAAASGIDVSSDAKALDYIRSVYSGDDSGLVDAITAIRANTGLSQGDIARVTGVDSDDLATLLEKNGIGWFDVGTNFVPRDMPAIVHRDERIIPAADNRALMQMMQGGSGVSGGTAEMAAEIRSLRQSNEALQSRLDAIAAATKTTADLLQRVTQNGRAMQSEGIV